MPEMNANVAFRLKILDRSVSVIFFDFLEVSSFNFQLKTKYELSRITKLSLLIF